MKSLLRYVVASTALLVATAGHANLVMNGGFETADFSGWTGTGNQGFSGVFCPGPGSAYEGNCAAFFGQIGSVGGISQTISGLTTGSNYLIQFALQSDGAQNIFSATFGGVALTSLTNIPASSTYDLYSFNVVATSPSESLGFNFRDDAGFLIFDAVSVTAAAATVPEPTTLALVGVALGGVFLSRRKKVSE